jgi:hypothetical protein
VAFVVVTTAQLGCSKTREPWASDVEYEKQRQHSEQLEKELRQRLLLTQIDR